MQSAVVRPATPLASLHQLQRTAGNVAIARVLRAAHIQPKLSVGPVDDEYEREADQVARQVMRMPEAPIDSAIQRAPLRIQRLCPECEDEQAQRQPIVALRAAATHVSRACAECEHEAQRAMEDEPKKPDDIEGMLQAKHAPGEPPSDTGDVESFLASSRGGGQPLSDSARAFFEPRFGHDFSSVRIHADSRSSNAAHSIQARAFTVGRDIVFGANQYEPGSHAGRTLLAHELTHVVQQGSAGQSIQRSPLSTSSGSSGSSRGAGSVESTGLDRSHEDPL